MRVLILGCGPAGLMAAHAAAQMGADVLIFSKARKSHLFGCQYLHAPIPGVSHNEPVHVKYTLEGTPEGYREKVYGSLHRDQKVSPESLEEDHLAWDIREAYDTLWDMYGRFVQDVDLMAFGDPYRLVQDLIEDYVPDVTISTVPASLICFGGHDFQSERVWAIGDAPEMGQEVPFRPAENTIVCDGTRDRSWYRASNVFGYGTIEWPSHGRKPPIPSLAEVEKPLKTDCNCHPGVHRMGRYGKWTKGVLSHEAFYETQMLLQDLFGTGIQDTLEGL